jgi:hypothetical protein
LTLLQEEEALFLIVGAHALAVHGYLRATGDLDIWVRPDPANAERVWKALCRFGAPVQAMGLTVADLAQPGIVYQIGLPPRRIDILTEISGVDFEEAWPHRVTETVGQLAVPFLGRQALIRNKKASGRAKDLADVETLEEMPPPPGEG